MHSPETCDINPVTMTWARTFTRGEFAKICGDCKTAISARPDRLAVSEHLCQTDGRDVINHPSHYNTGKIEVIEFIEDQDLNFARGNAVKYIARAGKKLPKGCAGRYAPDGLAAELEDLKKAKWYVTREIELVAALLEKRTTVRPNDMAK